MGGKQSDETQKPRKERMRSGYTTGACAAAAAKAATRLLVRGVPLTEIETTLPNHQRVTFPLERCEGGDEMAICSVIKDAGDDPDCTHGAHMTAQVRLKREPGIELRGGEGVATVTKPGLGLEVDTAAINPVPRKNITQMVQEELAGSDYQGAIVTISVPGGEEMAKKTLNARLGLVGGISILGTTGIVKPYSTSSWKASVVQAIDVAAFRGYPEVVLTTGGRTEQAAMRLMPHLPADAFIQMGDYVGIAVRHCATKHIPRAIIVGMMGKLSKVADGQMYTHARQSEVNMAFLASLLEELGAAEPVLQEVREANTARHVMEVCEQHGIEGLAHLICREAARRMVEHAKKPLEVWAYLVDFEGNLLGYAPAAAAAYAPSSAADEEKG